MVYNFREWLIDFSKEEKTEELLLMTEAYTNDTNYVNYFQSKTDPTRKGSQIPFNFAFLSSLDKYSNATGIKQLVDDKLKIVPEGGLLNWVVSNHDQPRAITRLGAERIDLVTTMVLTLPGIGITYYVRGIN